ncbi:chemotaxis protein [Pseudoalteromonas sp. APC 3224]|uniref:chemotaxis protein n=1 Tax=Pseudoalteromonas sp. APC 3224 TaxID=3035203 RepID=UPI0025B5306C|nr:chemotaxis protein [Pseudoalteromonas sp. APC 3224]MDN3487224.1 chemotaxis protein [Pseudoalteromonas sp. APC 3224]
MDLINFKVGYKTISLKILDILLTEQFNNNLTVLPNDNKSFLGVKDYMGIPTPVFDLGIILNGVSTERSNLDALKQLKSWQKQLIAWFNKLEQELLVSQSSLKTNQYELTDFEQFYTEFKTDNDELKNTMSRFDNPFKSLLNKLASAIDAYKQGNNKQVGTQLEIIRRHELIHLERLFDSAIEQITLDYKPIIVFTTKDGLNPHIGLLVDKVEDNIEYKKEDIKPLDKLTEVGFDIDPQTRNMMYGLIKLADKHSVLIDPSAIFKPKELEPTSSAQEQETEAYGLF